MKQQIKKLTVRDLTINVIASEEDIPVRGNAIASGDEAFDREVENKLIKRLEDGDIWAWCSVEVECSYKGLTASEYLGGCSYKSEKDFIKNSGYYTDMVQTCLEDIQSQLEALVNEVTAD
jgi:hypothetical protein